MRCEQVQRLLAETPGLVARAVLRLHLRGCSACRAEARQIGALDGALRELPRFAPTRELLANVLDTPRLRGALRPEKEGTKVKRSAYALTFVLVIALTTGGIIFRCGQPDARTLLLSAAEAVEDCRDGRLPWEEAERAYLRVLEQDPDNYEARLALGRMYTRWGRFDEALALLPPGDRYWSDLNRAFCLDALGRREEAMAIYTTLTDLGHDSVAAWARLGVERPTWPHDLQIDPEPGEHLVKPTPTWCASGSHTYSRMDEGPDERTSGTPLAAIDGDRATRWTTGGAAEGRGQAPGQWFELDFGSRIPVRRVVLDHYGTMTFYTNDWPRGLKALFTGDGGTWQETPVVEGGVMMPAEVRFATVQLVRGIRFELTASHSPEWWSIHEVYVFSPTR